MLYKWLMRTYLKVLGQNAHMNTICANRIVEGRKYYYLLY